MITTWKNIAVFLDATPEGEKLGNYAAEVAHRHGAHLIGIYGINRTEGERPKDAYARGTEAIAQVLITHKSADEEKVLAAGRHFAALAHSYALGAEFRVIWNGQSQQDAVLHSLHSDLVIVGYPKLYGIQEGWTPDRLLRMSGIPVLIVPNKKSIVGVGDKVLVAWNASREARRAITDAMPFIIAAKSTTILVIDAHKGPNLHGEEPGADVALHLARHGAKVSVEQVSSEGAPIGEVILAQATKQGADLIVAGARSHARSTEIIFGGVTRTLLEQLTVPLLLSR